jgi:hypothetical protein
MINTTQVLLSELTDQLELHNKKSAGQKLGEFAVKVCARCHAIHRLPSNLKSILE